MNYSEIEQDFTESQKFPLTSTITCHGGLIRLRVEVMSSLFGGNAECGPSNNPLNSLNKMFNQDNNSLNKQVRPPLPPVKRNITADHHIMINRMKAIQQVRALMEYELA